ncbi:SDR family NAD(P)-dependent oxidoreductase [Salmonirosea aquatica]|uniref:SDR family NAD(P)-dependent oxidoreductase n=1 Tax=Salmonirosea aquatica TaxID=2654236 RepID=A0A7C9BD56_9BACT|nr:SDR family NAD(P)-dependent oxidoreductase [Cytophagaceae bacterium SJW1-29]
MSLQLFDLAGKTALITGASQGIGLALSRGLGLAGARVILSARRPDTLHAAVQKLLSEGVDAHGYAFDVTNEAEVLDAVASIEATHGPLDILINNAGIIRRNPAENLTLSDWDAVILTNLTAPFMVAQAVGRQMIGRRGGKIINICSLMSELGRDTVVAYSAAKGGLKMLTRNLATEWAGYNIQVNGLAPGYIATPINADYRTPDNPLNDYILSRTPAGRWGAPADLVGTTIFLASAASDFVNGQLIYVDGGLVTTFGKPFNTVKPKD